MVALYRREHVHSASTTKAEKTHIISEALEGETQPDLLSRSAVAKMLIEQKADAAEEPSGDAETKANPQDETVRKGPPSAP
jgi:hypothetical protein